MSLKYFSIKYVDYWSDDLSVFYTFDESSVSVENKNFFANNFSLFKVLLQNGPINLSASLF